MPKNTEKKEKSELREALEETMAFSLRMARKYPCRDFWLLMTFVGFAINPSEWGKASFSEEETAEIAKADWMFFLDNLDSAEERRNCRCGWTKETLIPAWTRCAGCGKIE